MYINSPRLSGKVIIIFENAARKNELSILIPVKSSGNVFTNKREKNARLRKTFSNASYYLAAFLEEYTSLKISELDQDKLKIYVGGENSPFHLPADEKLGPFKCW